MGEDAGDGIVPGDEVSSTAASASHKASATSAPHGVVRVFCKVSATVGMNGDATLRMSGEPGYQPEPPEPQPRPEPQPEPEQAPTGAGAGAGAGAEAMQLAAGPRPSTSDAEALAQLMGPPISDALLQSLLNMSDAERRRLAEELLRSLSEDDLKALLQGMRRFPWEVDVECQVRSC